VKASNGRVNSGRRPSAVHPGHPAFGPTLNKIEEPFRLMMSTARTLAIRGALGRHHGNHTRAAECLGIQRTYLLRLLREGAHQ
jgi:transcriptional regulator with PAS, ATPase and Fis domain